MTPRAEATRKKLFDATLELTAGKGLATLTVDEIAARAGVAKGTVYYNFGSKDALVEALLRYGVRLLADRMNEGAELADPVESLESLVDACLAFIKDYPGFSQILVSEMWRTPGRWHDTLSLLRDEIISIIKARLDRLAAADRLAPGVEVPTAAAGLFGTVLVVALDWQVFQPHRSRTEVRDSVLHLARGVATPR